MKHQLKATVSKSFKQRKVVDNVKINIASGEIVGLLGPNGAGKTTCFYMIVGLLPVDSGVIYFDNTNITHAAMHQRARLGIGYLPQEASVFRKLSVHDNLLAVLQLRKDLSKSERHTKVDELLEQFHISHIKKSLGMSLSGGERRRVEIARALAMEPKFILLDEPFAGVDPKSVSDVINTIEALSKMNIGVLITDHNVRETLKICQRAYIVSQGQIICEGDAETVLASKQVRKEYLGEEFHL